jgi:hypothetical protein
MNALLMLAGLALHYCPTDAKNGFINETMKRAGNDLLRRMIAGCGQFRRQ